IRNRDKLTQATRESSAQEMQRLGLTIDSLQIQEITDPTGYIENLGMPQPARVAKEARIAQADAHREATDCHQAADALQAGARWRRRRRRRWGRRRRETPSASSARPRGPLPRRGSSARPRPTRRAPGARAKARR